MKTNRGVFSSCVAVVAAVLLAPASFARSAPAETPSEPDGGYGLRQASDIVNLLRSIIVPSPDPVLVSPAERAVSTGIVPVPAFSAASAPDSSLRIVTTAPFVVMPDIVEPDEDAGPPDTVADSGAEDDGAAAQTSAKRARETAYEDDSNGHPPFRYGFFFGEYVPYYKGWFYYTDRWFWGRRGPHPPEPPGWIPPPRPGSPDRPPEPLFPETGGGDRNPVPARTGSSGIAQSGQRTVGPKVPDGSIPVVPNLHRVPREVETQVYPPQNNDRIPVAPGEHRITGRTATRADSPQGGDRIPVAPGAHRIPRKNDR